MLGGAIKLPDCGDRDALPRCGSLQRVVNLSDRDVRVELAASMLPETTTWHTVVPLVRAGAAYEPPNAAIYLPRGSRLRTVDAEVPEGQAAAAALDHGVVGDGMIVVVPGE